MKVLVAAEDSGSIKRITFPRGTDTSSQTASQPESIETFAEQGRKAAVNHLIVVDTKDGQLIAVSRINGAVEVYDMEFEKLYSATEDEKVVALIHSDGHLITCTEEGLVTKRSLQLSDDKTIQFPVKGKKLSIMKQDPRQKSVFAFGGKDLDLEVAKLDFESGKVEQVFKAKNVKNDSIDMPVPVWVENIAFLSTNSYVTSTHYGQVRVYDPSKGRKPQKDFKVGEKPIKFIEIQSDSDSAVYSDNYMTTAEVDLKQGKSLGKFHGATGAVQGINVYRNSLLATGGLDRYLRVFDIRDRSIIGKVFVSSQIADLWVLSDDKRKNEDDGDELWDKLESSTKKSKKAKRGSE